MMPLNTVIYECDETQANQLIERFGGDWSKTDAQGIIPGGFWTADASEIDDSDVDFLVTVVGVTLVDENRQNIIY